MSFGDDVLDESGGENDSSTEVTGKEVYEDIDLEPFDACC